MNAQIKIYFSPVPDEKAAGLDAFNLSWDGWSVYLFPIWYPGLMALTHSTPLRLLLRMSLLRQPHNAMTHPRLSLLNLHAAEFCVA
jgi:hypothetical protein